MNAAKETVRLIGVDLGQQRDYTAISVTERVPVPTGEQVQDEYWDHQRGSYALRMGEKVSLEYRIRHLERPALGTSYTKVVERIVELVKALGGEPVLCVDATGVGRPVTDMLWKVLGEELRGTSVRVTPCNVIITGGDSVSRNPDGGGFRVPKRDLISATLVLLQNGQLKIAESLDLRETLVRELLAFRVKINIATAHDSYEAWREGDHDDLVLSVALSCWAGERFLIKPKLARVFSF
jgi:hypothetical protein